jgi:predicted MFS family arabinose efflux permease
MPCRLAGSHAFPYLRRDKHSSNGLWQEGEAMQAASDSEFTKGGVLSTAGAMIGLAFGPSVLAVLTISAYIQPIEAEFGWSRVQVSLAFTIVAYMIVLVSPLQGFVVDRYGPRRTVLASIPLFGLSLVALYFTPPSLAVYYLLWALVPVLGIGLWPLGYLQVISQWFERRLGFALGCANAGIGLGSTIVPLLTAALIPLYGWRGALLGLGLLVIFVSWPLVWLLLKEPAAGEAQHHALARTEGLAFNRLCRERSFLVLNIAFFLLGLTATSLVSQQVPLLTEAGWTPDAARAVVSTIFGFALLTARVVVGFVMDHVFAPRVMQTVAVGGAISCLLYALYPDAAILSAILLGFLLGAEFDVLAFLIKRYYGHIAYGRAYGVIFGVFYLGSGLGITGMAWMRQQSGSYDSGLFLAALILLGSAVLLFLLPTYRYQARKN